MWCEGPLKDSLLTNVVVNIDNQISILNQNGINSTIYLNHMYLYFNDLEQIHSPEGYYLAFHPKLSSNTRDGLVNVMVKLFFSLPIL